MRCEGDRVAQSLQAVDQVAGKVFLVDRRLVVKACDKSPPGSGGRWRRQRACTRDGLGDGRTGPEGRCLWPADSLLPGQTPAHEANCETLWNTVRPTPSSAMITAARVQSTPGICCNKSCWVAQGWSLSWLRCSSLAKSFSTAWRRSSCNCSKH